jgi:hypothetical protein
MKPYVFSRSGNWIMRYRETVNESGTLRTIQRAKILCSTKEADKDRARKLAKAEIEKLESYRPADPRLIVTLGDFFTNVSLPFVRTNRRGRHRARLFRYLGITLRRP